MTAGADGRSRQKSRRSYFPMDKEVKIRCTPRSFSPRPLEERTNNSADTFREMEEVASNGHPQEVLATSRGREVFLMMVICRCC